MVSAGYDSADLGPTIALLPVMLGTIAGKTNARKSDALTLVELIARTNQEITANLISRAIASFHNPSIAIR